MSPTQDLSFCQDRQLQMKNNYKMEGGQESYGKSRELCFSQNKDISEPGLGQNCNTHECIFLALVQLINLITKIVYFLLPVLGMLFSACWNYLYLLLSVLC